MLKWSMHHKLKGNDTLSLRENCPYSKFFWSVFNSNTGKYWSEKFWILTLFTQCTSIRIPRIGPFFKTWSTSVILRPLLQNLLDISNIDIRRTRECSITKSSWKFSEKATLPKRDSITSVLMYILRNFSEQVFCRSPPILGNSLHYVTLIRFQYSWLGSFLVFSMKPFFLFCLFSYLSYTVFPVIWNKCIYFANIYSA